VVFVSGDSEWDDDVTRVGDRAELEAAKAAPKRATQRAYLVVIAGRGVGSMYAVTPDMVIGRGDGVGVRIHDDELSRKHCRLVLQGASVVVEDLGSRNGTLVNGEPVAGRRPLADGDKIQVGKTTILKFSYHDELEATFQRQMYDAALRDPLTGAYNRKHFGEALASEMAYTQRHQAPLSLILFDLDFFKKVNDTYGHLGGDAVLVQVARYVSAAVRREDLFARYGGEEFAVLARGTSGAAASGFAERMRAGVEQLAIAHESLVLRVTVSLGVASAPAPDATTPEELIARADEALYAAKRGGRNRVVTHVPKGP
jgi:diguanylate cyclase (GGDEF)-like protein